MNNINNSFLRAQKLFKNSNDIEDYISIKIKPINGGCCCFHCWPNTWNEINKEISSYGELKDEGDILIGNNTNNFVLECHESGPEIIIYLGVGIAISNLLKSVLDIILTIIKNRQQEKKGSRFKIIKRTLKNKEISEENIIEIDFPISKENVSLLNKRLNDIIKQKR